MIRWHSSSRRRSGSAVSGQLRDSWSGRLILLAIAIGVVLMHHVVGAHQHSVPDVAPSDAAAHSSAARTVPSAGGHHAADAAAQAGAVDQHGVVPDGMSATGSAALLHQHSDENGHDHAGSLLHTCLAALVGAAVILLVLVLVALWWRTPPLRLGPEGVVPTTEPRAPPASSRLAELQILRL